MRKILDVCECLLLVALLVMLATGYRVALVKPDQHKVPAAHAYRHI